MLKSSPKCGRKGFRPAAVLESGLKGLEGLEKGVEELETGLEKLKGPDKLKELEELKGLEEGTDLVDEDVLQRKNGTSEDEENTDSSQAVEV